MNKVQKLHADLIRLASWHQLEGETIVNDLEANPDLWKSFYMKRNVLMNGNGKHSDSAFIAEALSEISNEWVSVDTLYILSTGTNDKYLEKLAMDKWNADSVTSDPNLVYGMEIENSVFEAFRIITISWK